MARLTVAFMTLLLLGIPTVASASHLTISDPLITIDGEEYILQPNLPPPPPPPPPTGSISGFVRDASGAPVAGATVTVAGGPSTTVAADGSYMISGLTVGAGAYSVSATLSGWNSPKAQLAAIVANTTLAMDFRFNAVIGSGFTSAERSSIQWVIWAANGMRSGDTGSLHDGNAAVLDLIIRDYTNANTREPLRALKDLVRQAQIDLDLAVADLLGAQIAPLGQPRDYYVQRAKDKIANVRTVTIPAINSAADTAKAAGAVGTYPATMDRFKSINIAGALSKLNLFNATLAYADPYPPSRGPDGVRVTIIGPHGDYLKSITWFGTALDRANRMYTAAIAGYGADALLPTYNNKYQQLKFVNLMLQKIGVSMGTVNGMQFSTYSMDPFFRVLGIFETLTHGGGGPVTTANDCLDVSTNRDTCHAISYDFNNLKIWTQGDSGQESTRPNFAAQQRAVMSEITETWQATDTAAWYMLKFPECEVAGGCGGL